MFLGFISVGESQTIKNTQSMSDGAKKGIVREEWGVPGRTGGPSHPIRGSGKTDTLRFEWKTPLSGEWAGRTALWGEGSRQRGREGKGQEG